MIEVRLLIHGKGQLGQTTHFLPVIVNHFDHLPVFTLSTDHIFSGGLTTPEENVTQTIRNALRAISQGSTVMLIVPDINVLEFSLPSPTWKMVIIVHYKF